MAFRYRLMSFGATEAANAKNLLVAIGGLKQSPVGKFSTSQWSALLEHLLAAGAQTFLIQDGVRDPDFLEEYEAFYSKQHRQVPKECIRVHAFSLPCPVSAAGVTQEQHVLAFIDAAAQLPKSYLGFTTIRPLRHAPVGATIVVDKASTPATCKDSFPVHIAGQAFEVIGTPYLQQDNAVGACAQASIWMALRTVRRRAGNVAYSPAELTLAATRYTMVNRVFPGRQGLTVAQMIEAIRFSGHDPLVISMLPTPSAVAAPALVVAKAKPYIESGLPVVMLLRQPHTGGHAVVAIGLTAPTVATKGPGLVIHNDNEGPYLSLPEKVPKASEDYSMEQAVSLIIPLPDGVLMSAAEAEVQAASALGFWLPNLLATPSPSKTFPLTKFVARVFLCTRHAFRRWAHTCVHLDTNVREAYRITPMPRLVWIVEFHDAAAYAMGNAASLSRVGEVVLDAAADALHGDAVIFARLTSQMVSAPTKSAGLLIVDGGLMVVSTNAQCGPILEPWD